VLSNAKLFRPRYFDSAIERRAYRDPGYATRDIVDSHRLEKHRRQMHFVANHGNIGKTLEGLKELGRLHDRIRNR